MFGYFGRVADRMDGWRHDAFIPFRWWDWPACIWYGLFGEDPD